MWKMCRGPQDHCQVWRFSRRTHRPRNIVIQRVFIKVQEYKVQSAKGTDAWVKSAGNHTQASSTSRVTQDTYNSSSNKLWEHGYQGSSLETQWLLRASHVPSVWHVSKFKSLRRKAGVQNKPHCLYAVLAFLSVLTMVGTLLKSKFP